MLAERVYSLHLLEKMVYVSLVLKGIDTTAGSLVVFARGLNQMDV